MALDHAANYQALVATAWRLLECESTVAEMAPHIAQADMAVLFDASQLLHDLRAARRIVPATTWRTPTDVRRSVVERIRATTEPAITRGARRRRR